MSEPLMHDLPTPLTRPFRVGEWEADPRANTLERASGRISLEPKVMDLLSLLAAEPGRIYSREELDAALWPDVTVGEDTLARAMSKLRRALGDAASAPHYIETIPKRGYRLIAEVAGDQGAASATKRGLPRAVVIGAVGFCVLVLAVFAVIRAPGTVDVPLSPAAETTERAHDLYMRFTRADNEAAIALYERAIAADPDYAPAQSGLANALVQRIVRWQTPPGAEPSANSLSEALANGITHNSDAGASLTRAIDLGERAVRLAPQDADALKALGFAYSAKGDLVRAQDIYEHAVELDGDAWEVMINLGELASIRGDRTASLNWFEQAYAAMDRLYKEEPQRIGPWRAPLGVLIGEAYEKAGDAAAAEAWYRRVLDQTPFEPEATTRLAALLQRRGAGKEAARLCDALNARIDAFTECDMERNAQ